MIQKTIFVQGDESVGIQSSYFNVEIPNFYDDEIQAEFEAELLRLYSEFHDAKTCFLNPEL